MKKAVSLILALTLCVALAVPALAEEATVYNGRYYTIDHVVDVEYVDNIGGNFQAIIRATAPVTVTITASSSPSSYENEIDVVSSVLIDGEDYWTLDNYPGEKSVKKGEYEAYLPGSYFVISEPGDYNLTIGGHIESQRESSSNASGWVSVGSTNSSWDDGGIYLVVLPASGDAAPAPAADATYRDDFIEVTNVPAGAVSEQTSSQAEIIEVTIIKLNCSDTTRITLRQDAASVELLPRGLSDEELEAAEKLMDEDFDAYNQWALHYVETLGQTVHVTQNGSGHVEKGSYFELSYREGENNTYDLSIMEPMTNSLVGKFHTYMIELSAPAAAPAAKPVVVPTAQKLTVNGEAKNTEIYNIDGSNYFKLRDMAMLLNGTGSQFSVDYDAARNTIVVKTGEAYTPVGGELATGTDKSASAVASAQSVEINGAKVELTAFNIGGNNFFKLRELGTALGFDVDYDTATATMIVKSR